MNILVTSAGRRVKIVEYFRNTLRELGGKVIAADCDSKAPALYFADKYEVVPRINDGKYIRTLLEICEKHNVTGIISLIDPELEILAKNVSEFNSKGIELVLSSLKMVQMSFDKMETFQFLKSSSIPVVPTFDDCERMLELLEKKEYEFPLVVKPRKGSASNGITIVKNISELKNAFYDSQEMVIQPFFKDREFGIDVYIDMLNGHLVDMFIKEKINMRAGETDKSISVYNQKLEKLIKEFVKKTTFAGPVDIDCFEKNGEYYISEINPRFGGGYPHAFEMGCNFMNYIINNLKGQTNPRYEGFKYKQNFVMMKYDNVKIIKENGEEPK